DLVPLDQNNRILVDAGLKRIRGGRMCPGIAALIDCGKRDPSRLVASDLGFAVAPRINAAGRLDDMRLGIECLLTDEASRAQELAQVLSSMNAQRRELQTGMVEQAEAEVRKWQSPGIDDLPFGVVMFNPDWHHGVVGLVASKLKETLHRPVIACAVAGDESSANSDSADAGGMIKASGRSIPGFHLRDALADVDVRHPGLIVRFGGHAMAAGLSLYKADIARFAAAFDAVARERMIAQSLQAAVLTDGELEATDFTLDLARQMRDAGPWGQNFAEPLFDGEFEIVSWKVMGEVHMRLMLRHNDVAQPLEAVMFNAYDGTPPPARIRIAFQLDVNTWNDTERLQLLIRHLEPAGLQIPDSSSTETPANV
ncbi:MAG: DHHA1 domain-containing protein, partial [Rudaea sp.]